MITERHLPELQVRARVCVHRRRSRHGLCCARLGIVFLFFVFCPIPSSLIWDFLTHHWKKKSNKNIPQKCKEYSPFISQHGSAIQYQNVGLTVQKRRRMWVLP